LNDLLHSGHLKRACRGGILSASLVTFLDFLGRALDLAGSGDSRSGFSVNLKSSSGEKTMNKEKINKQIGITFAEKIGRLWFIRRLIGQSWGVSQPQAVSMVKRDQW